MNGWPSFAILLFVLTYLASALLTLDGATRVVPLMAGAVTLMLLLIDIVRPAPTQDGAMQVPPRREMNAIAYVAAAVISIQLFGFWLTIPIYLFTSIAWLGKQVFRTALTVSVLTSLSIYLLFEVLLGYSLYQGLLLELLW
jgi:hypothetical protein